MKRKLLKVIQNPSAVLNAAIVPVVKGGTGATNEVSAADNINLLTKSMLGKPNGALQLNELGKIDATSLPPGYKPNRIVSIVGPTTVAPNSQTEYLITDFSEFIKYSLKTTKGLLTRKGNKLTYTAPAILGPAGFTVNGNNYVVTVANIVTPPPVVVMEPSGLNLFVYENNGKVYGSTDGGLIWNHKDTVGTFNWKDIAMSSNGNKVVILPDPQYLNNFMRMSEDRGNTWFNVVNSQELLATTLDISGDGNRIVAAKANGYIYVTDNKGVVWAQRGAAGIRNWFGLAVNDDGTKILACVKGGTLYSTTDGGYNWQEHANMTKSWSAVAMSGDGTKMMAVVGSGTPGYPYTSIDGGVTWTEHQNLEQKAWAGCNISQDGTGMIVHTSDCFYYTRNSGVTWNKVDAPPSSYWTGATISGNGMRMVAVGTNGYTKLSTDGGATWAIYLNSNGNDWMGLAM